MCAGHGLGAATIASLVFDIAEVIRDNQDLLAVDAVQKRILVPSYIRYSFPTITFPENLKFADGASLEGAFALADSHVDLAGLDASNIKSFEATFAGYAPSFSNKPAEEKILMFLGDARNIKLTLPEDLSLTYSGGVRIGEMFMFFHPETIDVSD